MGDTEYGTNTQRLNGVQQGIASSQLNNKFSYQTSLVAYALAQIMMQNGFNANDSDAVTTFVSNMSSTLLQKVTDKANKTMAEAGTDDSHFMTPLQVKYAIDSMFSAKLTSTYIQNLNYRIGDIIYSEAGAPGTNWLPCDGRTINQSTYSTLYNLLKINPNQFDSSQIIDLNPPADVYQNENGGITKVVYGNGYYCCLTVLGSSSSSARKCKILYSTDGINWSIKTTTQAFYQFDSFQFLNGNFICVGYTSVSSNKYAMVYITFTDPVEADIKAYTLQQNISSPNYFSNIIYVEDKNMYYMSCLIQDDVLRIYQTSNLNTIFSQIVQYNISIKAYNYSKLLYFKGNLYVKVCGSNHAEIFVYDFSTIGALNFNSMYLSMNQLQDIFIYDDKLVFAFYTYFLVATEALPANSADISNFDAIYPVDLGVSSVLRDSTRVSFEYDSTNKIIYLFTLSDMYYSEDVFGIYKHLFYYTSSQFSSQFICGIANGKLFFPLTAIGGYSFLDNVCICSTATKSIPNLRNYYIKALPDPDPDT